MTQYFIKTAAGEHGPMPEDLVRLLAAHGRLQPTDQVRRNGNGQWRFATGIRGYVPPASVGLGQTSPVMGDTSPTTSRRSSVSLIASVALGASVVTGTLVWAFMFTSRPAAVPNAAAPTVARENVLSSARQTDELHAPANLAPDPRKLQLDAQAALDAGNLDLAERLFRSLASLEPTNVNHRIALGRVLLEQEDAGGAASAFRSALRLDPSSAVALDGLGSALLATRDFRGAMEAWESALALQPKYATVTMKLLLAYTVTEKWDKAVPLAEDLAEQNRKLQDHPSNRAVKTSSLATLAAVYTGAGRRGDAEVVYREILSIDASHTTSLVGLAGIAFEQRDLVTARTMLWRIESHTADSLFLLCRVEALSENTPAAIRAARDSLAKDSKQPERWFILAFLEETSDRTLEAISAVDRAIEQDGSNHKFRILRARLLLSAKRFQESVDEAERAKALGAGTAEVQAIRGAALLGVGRQVEGVAALRLAVSEGTDSRVAATSPQSVLSAKQAALILARVHSEQERWEEVADVYGMLEKMSGEDAGKWRERKALAHMREAFVRSERGDAEGQLRQLRLAVEALPSAENKASLVNALALKALGLMQDRLHDEARQVVKEIAPLDRSEAAQLTRMIEEGEDLDRMSEDLRRRPEQLPTQAPSTPASGTIESRIEGKFNGLEYDNIYELQNGQIWKQTEYYIWIRIAVLPRVIIFRDGPSYKMKVDGIDRAVRVERLK